MTYTVTIFDRAEYEIEDVKCEKEAVDLAFEWWENRMPEIRIKKKEDEGAFAPYFFYVSIDRPARRRVGPKFPALTIWQIFPQSSP